MPIARHQRSSQRGTPVVVICGDGDLLTSAPSSVVGTFESRAYGLLHISVFIYKALIVDISNSQCFIH